MRQEKSSLAFTKMFKDVLAEFSFKIEINTSSSSLPINQLPLPFDHNMSQLDSIQFKQIIKNYQE